MKRYPHNNSLLAGGAAFHLWLAMAVLQTPEGAFAQETLRNTLAAQAATSAAPIDLEALPYTVKSGDFRLLLAPSLGLDWNNNINLSKTNTLEDFILSPLLKIDASYPISQVNLLRLDVGVGYDEYFEHNDYSNWRVISGSQLSFDTYIKDILINLHDRFSYVQDAGAQAVDVGTGNYATGNNVVGVTGTWNPRKLNFVLGYDHENVLSGGTPIQSQNGSAELFDGRAGWRFEPTAAAGIEATYSLTSYNQAILNNYSSYSIGAYGEWQPGSYFKVAPRAGYVIYDFQQTSQSAEIIELTPTGTPVVVLTGKPIQTSDLNSWYADLTLSHDITRALSYSLSVGHEIQSGIESDAVEDSYLRVSSKWQIIKNLGLNGSFSYEHGQDGAGNIAGNLSEVFDWYTGSVEINRQLTTRLRVGLNSRVTFRSSSTASLGYTQALIGLQLTYGLE